MKIINFYIISIVIATFFSGCAKVNTKSLNSVSEDFLSRSFANDETALKAYSSESALKLVRKNKSYFDKYKDSEVKILGLDSTAFERKDEIFDLYYKIDTSIHRMQCRYIRKKNGSILVSDVSYNNLSDSCAAYLEEPYVPRFYNINPASISWQSYNFRLTNFSIEMINNPKLFEDYAEVKFRLQVFRDGEEVINRTLLVPDIIYSGDTYIYSPKELKGTLIEPSLTLKNVSYKVTFLGAKHPQNIYCWFLNRAKLAMRKK